MKRRSFLDFSFTYPLHVNQATTLAVDFRGYPQASDKIDRTIIFQNNLEVLSYCPNIRAMALQVLRDIRADVDAEISEIETMVLK